MEKSEEAKFCFLPLNIDLATNPSEHIKESFLAFGKIKRSTWFGFVSVHKYIYRAGNRPRKVSHSHSFLSIFPSSSNTEKEKSLHQMILGS
jgi:hypothetical protein